MRMLASPEELPERVAALSSTIASSRCLKLASVKAQTAINPPSHRRAGGVNSEFLASL